MPTQDKLSTPHTNRLRGNLHMELTPDREVSFGMQLRFRVPASADVKPMLGRYLPISLFVLALACALLGTSIVNGPTQSLTSSTAGELAKGAPWIGLACLLWLAGELALS